MKKNDNTSKETYQQAMNHAKDIIDNLRQLKDKLSHLLTCKKQFYPKHLNELKKSITTFNETYPDYNLNFNADEPVISWEDPSLLTATEGMKNIKKKNLSWENISKNLLTAIIDIIEKDYIAAHQSVHDTIQCKLGENNSTLPSIDTPKTEQKQTSEQKESTKRSTPETKKRKQGKHRIAKTRRKTKLTRNFSGPQAAKPDYIKINKIIQALLNEQKAQHQKEVIQAIKKSIRVRKQAKIWQQRLNQFKQYVLPVLTVLVAIGILDYMELLEFIKDSFLRIPGEAYDTADAYSVVDAPIFYDGPVCTNETLYIDAIIPNPLGGFTVLPEFFLTMLKTYIQNPELITSIRLQKEFMCGARLKIAPEQCGGDKFLAIGLSQVIQTLTKITCVDQELAETFTNFFVMLYSTINFRDQQGMENFLNGHLDLNQEQTMMQTLEPNSYYKVSEYGGGLFHRDLTDAGRIRTTRPERIYNGFKFPKNTMSYQIRRFFNNGHGNFARIAEDDEGNLITRANPDACSQPDNARPLAHHMAPEKSNASITSLDKPMM